MLSEDERSQLAAIARSISATLVTRARIVLAAADGEPNSALAQRLQLTRATDLKQWPRQWGTPERHQDRACNVGNGCFCFH
ncbi:hypothetical protein BN2475_710052 [Paraburkholderia ribeironis]|uniref:Uncharacterized protein n=1 Tax=Paraburkholderia ribeironis TaxID=1247936 RepID=A0A1N7SIG6_9BURK|nr:hypothetical protein BN2475_710052 [Paraburkholderia ribeironis]